MSGNKPDLYVRGWTLGMQHARAILERSRTLDEALQVLDGLLADGMEAERRAAVTDGNARTRRRHA